jgi:hypothetical protein
MSYGISLFGGPSDGIVLEIPVIAEEVQLKGFNFLDACFNGGDGVYFVRYYLKVDELGQHCTDSEGNILYEWGQYA